jgi:3-hydroxyisobutyrate dehydrogenase-like beta-hydroxyacid dehydrogenase
VKLGVIGLGNIGGAIAANLLADGHEVALLDREPARMRAPGLELGVPVAAPAELARRAEIAFLSLPTPDAVDSVAAEWLADAAPGSLLVDLSTNAPERVRALGRRVAAAGSWLLEAPLTGGAPGARRRQLVFLCAGEAAAFERCRPLLEKLGRAAFHFGPHGLGNTAKLVNSLLAFTSTWVSLEGLAIAARSGMDLRQLVDAVRTGGASNFFMDRMVEGLGARGRPAHFTLELAAKDAGLVVDLARGAGVPAPVAEAVRRVFAAAAAGGLGARDWSDVALWMEREAGCELRLPPQPETKASGG